MYIAIEGIDTAGKSTQLENIKKRYPEAILTKEPGGSELGIKIRELVLEHDISSSKAELLLFLADRAEHLKNVIKPNIENMIVSDRSAISGMAYAMVKKDFAHDELIWLNKFSTDDIFPDIVFILELSEDELKHRLSQKSHDKIESRGYKYLLEIQSLLIKACEMLDIKYVCIDASKNIEEITDHITMSLRSHFDIH
jgi:dTMP kinase